MTRLIDVRGLQRLRDRAREMIVRRGRTVEQELGRVLYKDALHPPEVLLVEMLSDEHLDASISAARGGDRIAQDRVRAALAQRMRHGYLPSPAAAAYLATALESTDPSALFARTNPPHGDRLEHAWRHEQLLYLLRFLYAETQDKGRAIEACAKLTGYSRTTTLRRAIGGTRLDEALSFEFKPALYTASDGFLVEVPGHIHWQFETAGGAVAAASWFLEHRSQHI